jgi:ABC-type multidrug transport system fused ATPase/permease subunit
VLSAPVNTYFDVTPVGRILNRFSKDLDAMDSLLPDFLLQAIQNIFQIISIIGVCLSSSAYFVVLFVPIALVFYYIQSYFRKSSRELKRLESIARSPMYSLFGEILQGHSTIRAYGRVKGFTQKFFEITDLQVGNFFVFWMANRWLALRLDAVSNLIVFAVAILGVVITDNGGGIDANLLGGLFSLFVNHFFDFIAINSGIGLVYSLQLAFLLQLTVRLTIDAETNATSVERLLAFVDIPSEREVIIADPSEKLMDRDVSVSIGDIELGELTSTNKQNHYAPVTANVDIDSPTDVTSTVWPSKGGITFDNLKIRYRPDLNLVLHGEHFEC